MRSKNNYWLILIIAIAIFARLYNLSWDTSWQLEYKLSTLISIILGIISVIGVYFLTKEVFDKNIASLSALLMAVSSWHVFISRLGSKDIFTSFALIFTLYFIWHGLKYGHNFDFFLAGIIGGAGFYSGRVYLFATLVILSIFLNYWDFIKKDFSISKYEQTKRNIIKGFALLVITSIVVALPVYFYIWQNPGFVLPIQKTVFINPNPFSQVYQNLSWLAQNILLPEFNNSDLVSWPISIFFVVGFIKEFIHWLKKKHGHFSISHTLVFSWLFLMLIPALFSINKPSPLSLAAILPVVMIISAKGIWWFIERLNKWEYSVYPYHKHKPGTELNAMPYLTLIAIMLSIALLEIF